jgi:hypothetical protein
MKNLARALAFVLALLPAVAAAQTFPTVPSGTVIGRTAIGTGPAQAIPITTLIASMLNPLTVTSVNTASVIYRGSTSGTATVSAQAVAGTPVIKWPTTSGTVPTTATLPIVLDAVTGNLTCPTCMLSLTTRAAAAALDLSAYTAVRTLSYAAAGDGGGASFKKVGSTPFLDSHVLTGTISAAGTGYGNGTYQLVEFTGGTGTNFFATVTVAGGVVTSVVKTFNPGGYGYTAADVLTASNAQLGGTGSGFTYTVSTVSTPLASFTDAAGNHWQYVPDTFIDPRQFGAKFDWSGTDASATDDSAALQAALNFGSYGPTRFSINGTNFAGTKVLAPKGMALVCNALTMYGATQFFGQGPSNTNLHMCDAFPSAASHFVTICDPLTHLACFGPQIADMTLSATATAPGNADKYMIYSNAAQQARAISNVAVYTGKRGCFRYDTGYGGAAIFTVHNLFCTLFSASLSDGVVINAGTTLIKFYDTIVEGSYTGNAVNLIGGQITFDGFHVEAGPTTGININMTTSTHSATVKAATGGSSCTELIKLANTNTLGNFAIYDAVKNGCTRLVTNGQPAGSNRTTDAAPKDGLVAFNP